MMKISNVETFIFVICIYRYNKILYTEKELL